MPMDRVACITRRGRPVGLPIVGKLDTEAIKMNLLKAPPQLIYF